MFQSIDNTISPAPRLQKAGVGENVFFSKEYYLPRESAGLNLATLRAGIVIFSFVRGLMP